MKKYKIKRNKSKNLVLFLLFVLLLLNIGYAIFENRLRINGNIVGNANFEVHFIEAWVEDPSKGAASINTT